LALPSSAPVVATIGGTLTGSLLRDNSNQDISIPQPPDLPAMATFSRRVTTIKATVGILGTKAAQTTTYTGFYSQMLPLDALTVNPVTEQSITCPTPAITGITMLMSHFSNYVQTVQDYTAGARIRIRVDGAATDYTTMTYTINYNWTTLYYKT
jgi:hypothetical protein